MVDLTNGGTGGSDDIAPNNAGGANGGDNPGGNNPGADDKGGDGGDEAGKKKDEPGIPKYRFDEVNGKLKSAEEELAKYKELEAKEAEKKKKEAGKYEEIITAKDEEITNLKTATAVVDFLTEQVSTMLGEQLTAMQEGIGKEKMDKILSLVGYDNLDIKGKIESLSKVKELVGEIAPKKDEPPKNAGGSGMGGGNKGGSGDATTFGGLLKQIVTK